jgi:hypothetical protein
MSSPEEVGVVDNPDEADDTQEKKPEAQTTDASSGCDISATDEARSTAATDGIFSLVLQS